MQIDAQNSSCMDHEKLCRNIVGCVGFNSKGYLKNRLLPYTNWTHSSSEEGLYVLDYDYCINSGKPYCPQNTSCTSFSGGRYYCEAMKPILKDEVHVVLSVDSNQSQGLLALLNSLRHHCSKKLIIHIITNTSNLADIKKIVLCTFPTSPKFQINFIKFDLPESMKKLIVVHKKKTRYLANAGNYARFYVPFLFPSLTHILYLDVDTIVLHDISQLWKAIIASDKLVTAIPRQRTMKKFFSNKMSELYKKRNGRDLKILSQSSYNAGVLGLNLKKWREKNLTDEVIYWMRMNKQIPLWKLGTQPIIYIVTGDDWNRVDKRWNVDGLGYTHVSPQTLKRAYILHWTGRSKPWLKKGKYIQYWIKYSVSVCNGKGRCILSEKTSGMCECDEGYGGTYCEVNQLQN